MAGILGLGTGTSSNLNGDLITKLKTTELNNINQSFERYNNIYLETDIFSNTKSALTDFKSLLENITSDKKQFDFSSNGDNLGVLNLKDNTKSGIYEIDVTSLARRSVHQSDTFNDKNQLFSGNIDINGTTYNTNGLSYDSVNSLLKENGFNSNIEQVSNDSFRLVIKSTDSGIDNGLIITNSNISQVQSASNLNATIDGVSYSLNTNKVSNNNFDVELMNTGNVKIYVQEKDLAETNIKEFVETMNSLKDIMDNNVDTQNLFREMKNTLFNSENRLSLFKNIDINSSTGHLSLKTDNNIKDNYSDLKIMLKDLLEKVDSSLEKGGIVDTLISQNSDFKNRIEEDLETQKERINERYDNMEKQFVLYTSIISSMEASFSGLKMMIQQAGNDS